MAPHVKSPEENLEVKVFDNENNFRILNRSNDSSKHQYFIYKPKFGDIYLECQINLQENDPNLNLGSYKLDLEIHEVFDQQDFLNYSTSDLGNIIQICSYPVASEIVFNDPSQRIER